MVQHYNTVPGSQMVQHYNTEVVRDSSPFLEVKRYNIIILFLEVKRYNIIIRRLSGTPPHCWKSNSTTLTDDVWDLRKVSYIVKFILTRIKVFGLTVYTLLLL
jgi:hypothetical protein